MYKVFISSKLLFTFKKYAANVSLLRAFLNKSKYIQGNNNGTSHFS